MTPVKTSLSASGKVEFGAKYSISTPLVMVSVFDFVRKSSDNLFVDVGVGNDQVKGPAQCPLKSFGAEQARIGGKAFTPTLALRSAFSGTEESCES